MSATHAGGQHGVAAMQGGTAMEAGGVKRVGEALAAGQAQGGANKRRAALGTLTNRQAGGLPQARQKPVPHRPASHVAPLPPAPAPVDQFIDDASGPTTTAVQQELLEEPPKLVDVVDAPLQDFIDIDAGASHLEGGEYIEEIHSYLRTLELRFRPNGGYMRKQRDISHSMRSILVDWLVEVAEEYRLQPQTLYIAVGYIDRFLSEMSVQRGKLQLVGVTCMLLAAKYEEIYPPAIDEFVYITDHTYTKDQILKMEHLVLKVLRFDMGPVTILTFLRRFLAAAHADDQLKLLASYVAEMTMQHGDKFMQYIPSMLAASAVSMAMAMLRRPFWSSTLEHYTKYTLADLTPCMRDMHAMTICAPKCDQQAVREKYGRKHFLQVSGVLPLPECPV